MIRSRVVRWSIDPHGAARDRTIREAVIVEVTRPSGVVGYGEAAPLAPGDSIGTVLRALEDPRVHSPSARFAVETAELDALAKERGISLAAQLGASTTTMPIAVVVDHPEPVAASCIKIKVGPDGDLDRIRAIAAANPHAMLRIDANQSWPRDTVHARCAALADLPIEFIEEPCVDAHTLVGLALPLALDESLAGDPDLANVAVVVLKPTLLGGIDACRRLATRARERGIGVVVTHALEGPIGMAACTALALAIGGDRAAGLGPHPALEVWEMRACDVDAPGLGIDLRALEDAIVALRDPLSIRTAARDSELAMPRTSRRERCILATPAAETIDAIHAALDERRPIALVHHRLPEVEQARQRAVVEHAALDEGDVVLFTSGSTGAARGVVLSRDALIAASEASAAHLGWHDDDRWLLALSMAHAGGLAVVVRCLAARRALVLAGDSLADSLARCTLASLVPTQLAQLLDDPAWTPPPKLRAILLGGAAAPPSLLAAAAARGVPFLTTYGMTESFGQVATAPLDRAGQPSAPLVPLGHVTLRAGTPDDPQPIRVRSSALARRYLDGEPIAPAFTTADLGYLDGGALHVVGRADDMIITGGENVHPQQIEAVLAATPGVRAACAFGVDDERWGQRVACAIAVDLTFDLGPALARWHATLPPHARPREVATVETLPTSPNGKLDRRAASRIPRARV
ncbi:MAG: AMP-binding protein [Myxococcota bacterium]|nr:AMP-binding protein [Myxococcota bacterium]